VLLIGHSKNFHHDNDDDVREGLLSLGREAVVAETLTRQLALREKEEVQSHHSVKYHRERVSWTAQRHTVTLFSRL